uniref:BTB domain-containing protein n=1 Tax=Chromera velia CCMP2878 TaxID=1169474 RepID=A0A0G4FFM4_9ALVE|eukprot:Cvel_16720.t1-p1 / transcript=Cvel_16720.t1 / gene=Cvel_16720 / organism=Chromera_velia_CCMP2878 / gene_product=Acyl-CoA-binding domain-containing protein 4, putative / transcript_product=Acyl-CoA-binding domain-containing protein 4, putative / location=Cvel_scaffold1300:1843-8295(-) / protein_length=668 / sequence_SO=supercontig / SO=protein_coding / is_pseudo=false
MERHAADAFGAQLFIHGGHDGKFWLQDLHMLDVRHMLETKEAVWTVCETSGPPPSARACHTLTRVKNFLLVFGGYDGCGCNDELHLLDLNTWSWKRALSPAHLQRRNAHAACGIRDKFFVFGGHSGKEHIETLDVFDVTNFSWTRPAVSGSLPVGVRGHSMTTAGDSIIMFGGADMSSAPAPRQRHSTALSTLSTQPQGGSAIAEVLVFGGFDGSEWLSDLHALRVILPSSSRPPRSPPAVKAPAPRRPPMTLQRAETGDVPAHAPSPQPPSTLPLNAEPTSSLAYSLSVPTEGPASIRLQQQHQQQQQQGEGGGQEVPVFVSGLQSNANSLQMPGPHFMPGPMSTNQSEEVQAAAASSSAVLQHHPLFILQRNLSGSPQTQLTQVHQMQQQTQPQQGLLEHSHSSLRQDLTGSHHSVPSAPDFPLHPMQQSNSFQQSGQLQGFNQHQRRQMHKSQGSPLQQHPSALQGPNRGWPKGPSGIAGMSSKTGAETQQQGQPFETTEGSSRGNDKDDELAHAAKQECLENMRQMVNVPDLADVRLSVREVVDLPFETLGEFLGVAAKVRAPRLVSQIEQRLADRMSAENSCTILQLADTHQAASLRQRAVHFIVDNFGAVSQTRDYDLLKETPNLLVEVTRLFGQREDLGGTPNLNPQMPLGGLLGLAGGFH